jgi:uncharacterized protein YegP (UPF0339 family)
MYRGVDGQWRWRLKSVNNKIIADSGEGYVNYNDCLHAIALVKGSGAAPVYRL